MTTHRMTIEESFIPTLVELAQPRTTDMHAIDQMLDDYRRQREADTPRKHAQRQVVRGWDVEFQPDHLLCDDCWELASSALTEAVLNGRTGRATLNPGEHGMCAEIKEDN